MASEVEPLPKLEAVILEREGRLLKVTLNHPEKLNAASRVMHDDLVDALWFAQGDAHSDLVVLTGAGRAFCAGGDVDAMLNCAAHPHLFDHEARTAKRLVFTLLDIDKPVICRMNGHAIGLGATIALLCDIVIAAEGARIGDPHVGIGLVAGDGGAAIWAQRAGLGVAKEFLLTGDSLTARRAAELGLVNRCVPADELDAAVDAFCQKLLGGAMEAIRATKVLLNLELKRVAHAVMDAGIAYEALSVRSADHLEGITAFKEKRPPRYGQGS